MPLPPSRRVHTDLEVERLADFMFRDSPLVVEHQGSFWQEWVVDVEVVEEGEV